MERQRLHKLYEKRKKQKFIIENISRTLCDYSVDWIVKAMNNYSYYRK